MRTLYEVVKKGRGKGDRTVEFQSIAKPQTDKDGNFAGFDTKPYESISESDLNELYSKFGYNRTVALAEMFDILQERAETLSGIYSKFRAAFVGMNCPTEKLEAAVQIGQSIFLGAPNTTPKEDRFNLGISTARSIIGF